MLPNPMFSSHDLPLTVFHIPQLSVHIPQLSIHFPQLHDLPRLHANPVLSPHDLPPNCMLIPLMISLPYSSLAPSDFILIYLDLAGSFPLKNNFDDSLNRYKFIIRILALFNCFSSTSLPLSSLSLLSLSRLSP